MIVGRRQFFTAAAAAAAGTILRGASMPEQLMPESAANLLADIDRRLRILESAQRLGLNRLRMAHSYGAAVSPTVFGAYETGPAGAQYLDDQGAIGSGYPQLTMTTGSRALFIAVATINLLANNASARSRSMFFGIGADGANPGDWTNPRMYRQLVNSNADEVRTQTTVVAARTDLTPGTHTFRIHAKWSDDVPAAGTLPYLFDAELLVIPIDL